MPREVDDFFDEIETKIPDDVSHLVEKQMDIAEAIAGAIDKSKYKTRKEFAQAIGMKPSMLSRILAGNVNLTLKTITKIEAALKTEIISIGVLKSVQKESISKYSYFNSQEPLIPYKIPEKQKRYSEIYGFTSKSDYNAMKKEMYEARA